MIKQYISPKQSKTFDSKSKTNQSLINTTLFILEYFGIPLDATPRRLERMAIAFLACGDVKTIKDLNRIKDSTTRACP